MRHTAGRMFLFVQFLLLMLPLCMNAQDIQPLLEFPEQGMDDPLKYREYKTRFFRDSKKNTVQIYVQEAAARLVHLWADAANESLAFTVRDAGGAPAGISWDNPGATLSGQDSMRFLQHTVRISASSAELGHFLLGSMRKERDFQYFKKHLLPYDSEPFHEPEYLQLIANLKRLPEDIRSRHLEFLQAKTVDDVQARLNPVIAMRKTTTGGVVTVKQISFDGKNHLQLEFHVGPEISAEVRSNKVVIRSERGTSPIVLHVKIGTDSDYLHPLDRKEIFNDDFWKFYEESEAQKDSAVRFRWLDRQVRGMELLSSREKLMAGLPNFATYFGRDTMMSALMMEPIWTVDMLEHSIASVLRKISENGEVSHEEALGGQAIRENADAYNKLIEQYFQADDASRQKILASAEAIVKNLQAVRENYHMVDDDFQFAVLIGRYLARSDVPSNRKRAFLQADAREEPQATRLSLLLKNLVYVSRLAAPYIKEPIARNLVSFAPLEAEKWRSSSWRDSGVGYANGRFAMDINAIWVPQALESIGKILDMLPQLDFTMSELESFAPEIRNSALLEYIEDRPKLQRAAGVWNGAEKHFWVRLSAQQVRQSVESRIAALPKSEAAYWKKFLTGADLKDRGVEFLALSLDADGKPIPVMNSDPATYLFLVQLEKEFERSRNEPEDILKILRSFTENYPVGLFVSEIGPLAANDAYASRAVWEMFRNDEYHSPRVVWGREVNLLILGLAQQLREDPEPVSEKAELQLIPAMKETLQKTIRAVEASGLKHNELWSYRIEEGNLVPVRYGTSSDVQLWNITDLAVQYLLQKLSPTVSGRP